MLLFGVNKLILELLYPLGLDPPINDDVHSATLLHLHLSWSLLTEAVVKFFSGLGPTLWTLSHSVSYSAPMVLSLVSLFHDT